MSHQGEDGWYPECKVCDCGNLGNVVCEGCYKKLLKEFNNLKKKLKRVVK